MTPVTDGDQSLDPRSIIVARLSGAILVVALALPSLVGVAIVAIASPWNAGQKLGLFILWLGLAGLGATVCIVWPAARYRHTTYRVDDRGLTIREGIIWRGVTSVPKSRVQHTDVLQGPLQRRFDLATLVIHTAGTQNASVSLSGLAHRVALPLRDFLLDSGDEEGV